MSERSERTINTATLVVMAEAAATLVVMAEPSASEAEA